MTNTATADIAPFKLDPVSDLHPRQLECYFSPATEILYGGSAGSGKSMLLRYLAVVSCLMVPGLQVYLFRRTHPDLFSNHMNGPGSLPDLIAPLIDAKQATINFSRGSLEFWNGSKIHLSHCQYEKDKYKYQGAEIHLLLIDELTHFSREIYTYLRGRVRLGGLKLPDNLKGVFPKIVNGSNPGGIGHNWVKSAWIDPQPPGVIWVVPIGDGGMQRQFIPALLSDNPTLTENDPDYKNRLKGLDNPALVKAMLDGNWDIVSGGAIDDIWQPETHIIDPFTIPNNWKIDRSFDWGSSKPFSVCWWAESNGEEVTLPDGTIRSWPRGTLFLIDEWYGWNDQPDQGCKMLASEIAEEVVERDKKYSFIPEKKEGSYAHLYQTKRTVKAGPADSSIFDVENGMCVAADMAKKGCRWARAEKGPGSRKNGLELVRQRLKAATIHPMEDPGLFVFSTCRQFIRTVPVLPRSEKDMEDVDTRSEDHIYDAVRYRILRRSSNTKVLAI